MSKPPVKDRRDFLVLTSYAMGAAGIVGVATPMIQSLNPAADVEATASTEVDLKPISLGQSVTVMWRGKPVFVKHRTKAEIQLAKQDDTAKLIDPETDIQRFPHYSQWLVVLGSCTHLGCIPLGQKPTDNRGEYGGWFCPCHGSHYDVSGRIRKGPAPLNLIVPPHRIKEHILTIGEV